ncbi:MAG TPA: efflux RND transporter periplasmic adaptor subunit [Longimicrobium sp.]|jgi:multidrug resistance efflux pump|uniref:HlyD family secretion protein n=1 Tax=Longimicrobium sp. TaxID=2029185 RepID=UPI002ED9E247
MSEARATASNNVIPLRLPELGDEGQPGGRFVKRAVSVTLGVIALLFLVTAVVSMVVSMDVTVKSAGVLEPVNVWPIRAQAAGPIREVLVQSGDTVKPGDVVIRLDALALETQLAQLEAQYRAAQLDRDRSLAGTPVERRQQAQRLANAEARLTRSRALLVQRMVEYGFGSNPDSLLRVYRPGQHVMLDQAVGEVRGAEADIRLNAAETDMLSLRSYDERRADTEMDRLQAQIRESRERISRTSIVAPSGGVVLTEQLERLPGAFVREGETLMEVGEVGEWRVTMLVPERDVHKINVGDRVRLEVQAFGQRERRQLEGRVSHVAAEPAGASPAGSGDAAQAGGVAKAASSGPGLYRVVASLDRGQVQREELDRFRRGYSVQANVVTRSGRIAELAWGYLREKLNRK